MTSDPSAGRRVVDLTIPSDVAQIEHVVERVQQELRALDYDRRHIALNVPVALSEALSNAILRGNGDDPRTKVRVRVVADRERVVVEIEDEGKGFDLEAVRIDPTTPDQLDREDGRGLFLMRKLMDRVEQVSAARGNVVRMTLMRAS
jgi:serine/threonine-protein kinase RsbW